MNENPISTKNSRVQTNFSEEEVTLPLELAIIILSHLVNDMNALARCGLVCRAWLSLTRHTVFSHLHLSQHKQRALIARFSDLFSNPLSTIPYIVTSLTIVDPLHDESQSILPLLDTLTNITSLLEIANQSPFFTPGKIPMAIATQHCTNIKTLKIVADFPDFRQMIAFICAFPRLESLDLDADWEGPGCDVAHRPSSTLRVLRIRSFAKFTLQWLVSLEPDSRPPIGDLTLTTAESSGDNLSTMNALLKALGSSLRHLTCDLRDYGPDNFPSIIDLKYNSALESLKIISFVRILMTCKISTASRQVQLRTFDSFNPRIISFQDIDQILSTLRCPTLEKPSDSAITGDADTGEFPLCRQRGISCVARAAGDDVEQFHR